MTTDQTTDAVRAALIPFLQYLFDDPDRDYADDVDSIVACLAEKGMTIAQIDALRPAGENKRALYVYDGDAGENMLYIEGEGIRWPEQPYVNKVIGPFETRLAYLCQSDDALTNALYDAGILWSETYSSYEGADYDGGFNDHIDADQWEKLWDTITSAQDPDAAARAGDGAT